MSNLAKDITKRELYELVILALVSPAADVKWLRLYGESLLDTAGWLTDKLLERQRAREFGNFTDETFNAERECANDGE